MRSPHELARCATVAFGLIGIACAQNPAAAESRLDLAQLCATPSVREELRELISVSHVIIIAAAQVPKARLLASSQSASPDYVNIPLTNITGVKGTPPQSGVILKFYPEDKSYAPTTAAILAADKVPHLYFLTQLDTGPVGFYFAGYTPRALQTAEPVSIEAVRKEIARQQRILESWKADESLPHYEDVRLLIGQLATATKTGPYGTEAERDAQQEVFRRLEALGEHAVPAVIAQMDDYRPLAFREISLVNKSPDAWEGVRYYGPERIVDGLDAVLGQITGKSLGGIHNGGSERERRAAVDAWRIFAASRNCAGPNG